MSKAIIVGSAGQDGRILSLRLQRDKVSIASITRKAVEYTGPEVGRTGIQSINILDPDQVRQLVDAVRPDEVYYLAAFHHSAEDARPDSLELYRVSHEIHVMGLLHFLEAIRRCSPQARLFYAASSHVFGNPETSPQNESTPLSPQCIYGTTKTAGIHLCHYYRAAHAVHASVGILYNHESPFRRPSFLASKVISAALAIRDGNPQKLVLGDLSAQVDWGYAPDYVDAMVRILALPAAEDFVIASGTASSVSQFVQIVFDRLGLDWKAHVVEDPSLIVRRRSTLVGDSTKLRRATGWKPTTDLVGIVDSLLRARGVAA